MSKLRNLCLITFLCVGGPSSHAMDHSKQTEKSHEVVPISTPFQKIPFVRSSDFAHIGYELKGSQAPWWTNGYKGKEGWFKFQEPAFFWIDRDQKTAKLIAGAFAFDRYEILLQHSILVSLEKTCNKQNEIIRTNSSMNANAIISWERFAKTYPEIAAAFDNDQKKAATENLCIFSEGACLVKTPKSPTQRSEHRSDVITYWQPSEELFDTFIKTATLVKNTSYRAVFSAHEEVNGEKTGSSQIAINRDQVTDLELIAELYTKLKDQKYAPQGQLALAIRRGAKLHIDNNNLLD